jgi:multiple sugar transport system ATP-binding protein
VNVLFQIDAPPLERDETAAAAEEPDAGELFVAEERHAVFTARVDARTRVTPGASIRLTVNPDRFHYFDPETGLAISRTHAAAPA